MIKKFSDHSANERTYLAWLRTSIAIMGLGFIIEKFDLFMIKLNLENHLKEEDHFASLIAEITAFTLFITGASIIILATYRFIKFKQMIDSNDESTYGSHHFNLFLSILLILIVIFLFAYFIHQLH